MDGRGERRRKPASPKPAFIQRVNSWLGYTRSTLRHLQRFSRTWKQGERIDILDLATGSADIPRAILKWADRNGFNIRIIGVDRHAITANTAAAGEHDPRLQIIQADVFNLPFAPASFDYVLTAMFLHHLDEAQAVTVMKHMNSLARRGVIVADLLRHSPLMHGSRFLHYLPIPWSATTPAPVSPSLSEK